MAKTIPNEEKVFMVSKSTNTTYSGSASLKAMQEWYTMEDVANTVKPYKVFTALLTQSGDGSEIYVENFSTSGTQNIVKGTSYFIDVNSENVDFSSIGAPSNVEGTNFIATVDKLNIDFPDTTWALVYNTGAPVVNVLENTIGNIWFTYSGEGAYLITSNALFTENKTILFASSMNNGNDTNNHTATIYTSAPNELTFASWGNTGDNQLELDNSIPLPIEIRVYN